jgi:hypothetical protein
LSLTAHSATGVAEEVRSNGEEQVDLVHHRGAAVCAAGGLCPDGWSWRPGRARRRAHRVKGRHRPGPRDLRAVLPPEPPGRSPREVRSAATLSITAMGINRPSRSQRGEFIVFAYLEIRLICFWAHSRHSPAPCNLVAIMGTVTGSNQTHLRR